MNKPRARDLGLPFNGKTGKYNAITDVRGVEVGFITLTDPKKDMRTGVTAVLPRGKEIKIPRPVWAGHFALNGNGEMTGTHWVDDAGYFIGPVCITNTHAIGAVHEGTVKWMLGRYRDYFTSQHAWAIPIIAETYDGVLNDINAFHVTPSHAIEALNSAKSGPLAEGSVGGGNGMMCYEFKGGTGTSSRLVETDGETYVVGVLVQANHGKRDCLTICGKNVGKIMPAWQENSGENPGIPKTGVGEAVKETGSVIVIIATDVPLGPLQLRQLAKRASIGIGRGGTPGGNSSGDIFLAMSLADEAVKMPDMDKNLLQFTYLNNHAIDPVYRAVVEATEEAVVNALVAGETVIAVKPRGKIIPAIDTEILRGLFTE
ncbi:hypothetical protein CHS0354_035191 [Potamilus streckersoni]|uniref:Aminopeptidase n=1 Tax=Potamilus streckersoni TaxID=2493646 RepID=A0AAE0VPD3_9BIVA|nr:hypothetical protein CHS0354_035191 [Potamilus streckersoni]